MNFDYRCPNGHVSSAPGDENGIPWSVLGCPTCGMTALREFIEDAHATAREWIAAFTGEGSFTREVATARAVQLAAVSLLAQTPAVQAAIRDLLAADDAERGDG